ncbi:hypothetical protein ONA91_25515 [Micromonospora sp. DR5-3]|uniref:hypothetical protein n=1 Tax=unclassified Micromonospora TaxID=2617518 RepID=UPI0011D7758E|nr:MULTISPECIES: hypothetical protein [unclassified Micromonospora]MCW3817813.1 hypothetical protein [Micromonospora sp. DR5-3]TYC21939.1 hypothetical protein FXF52_23255 [Micromonospora sp. MP36]
MRDEDVLNAVSNGLSGLDMQRPAEEIVAAGNARRRRRAGVVTMAAVALAAGLAVGVPSLAGSGPGAPPTAQRPAATTPMHPAAFSLVSNPNGTVALTLSRKQLADPDALRKALADAGVRAKVTTDGTMCNSVPAPRNMGAVFPSTKQQPDEVVVVIDPAAMKPGSVVVIQVVEPDGGVVAFGLAWEDKLTCSKPRR